MDLDVQWIWKSVIIVLGGTILLRIAGRKSISQMTLAQVVIMVGIGSLLIQPLAGENIWSTLFVGAMLVITLIIVEYFQLKFDVIEQLITGRSKVLIKDGILNERNLRKVRLTVDQLETQLRQRNINTMSDVKWATLEPNGQIGFILKENAKNSTKQDTNVIKQDLQQLKQLVQKLVQAQTVTIPTPNVPQNQPSNQLTQIIKQLNKQINDLNNQLSTFKTNQPNLFTEIENNSHVISPPKHLQ